MVNIELMANIITYLDTFLDGNNGSGGINNVFGNVPYLNTGDLERMSAYASILAFYRTSPEDFEDRVRILTDYLEVGNEFSSDNDSFLSRMESKICKESLLQLIATRLTTAYDTEPVRTTTKQELSDDFYKDAKVDRVFQSALEQAFLTSTIAVQPAINSKDEMNTQIFTPERYGVELGNDGLFDVKKIIHSDVHHHRGEDIIVLIEWTDEEKITRLVDYETIIEREPNKLRRIPFAFMYLGHGNKFFDTSRIDLLDKQLVINKKKTLSDSLASSYASPLLYTNIESGIFTRSPDNVIFLPDSRDETAEAYYIRAYVDPTSYKEMFDSYEKESGVLKEYAGIPNIDDQNLSGISKEISNASILEIRQKQIPSLITFENDFYDLVRDLGFDFGEFEIEFKIPEIVIDKVEDFEFDVRRNEMGLISDDVLQENQGVGDKIEIKKDIDNGE